MGEVILSTKRPRPETKAEKQYYYRLHHLAQFMGAVHSEVPEVFVDLKEKVYPELLRLGDVSEYVFKDVLADERLSTAIGTWQEAWSLLPAKRAWDKITLSALMTCLVWQRKPDKLATLFPASLIVPFGNMRIKYKRPSKRDPPEYRQGESKEDYLERSKLYWEQSHYRQNPTLLGNADNITMKPLILKRNPKHYQWAAYYQCKHVSLSEAAGRYTVASESDFLTAVSRTLDQCGILKRVGLRGPKR